MEDHEKLREEAKALREQADKLEREADTLEEGLHRTAAAETNDYR